MDAPTERQVKTPVLRKFVTLLCLLAAPAAAQIADQTVEYQVKAAFLLNFAKFVEWPANRFATPDSPFVICVLGKDPFGQALDNVVQGETVNSHKLVVERIGKPPAPGMCGVVFVGSGEKDLPELLGGLGPGVLTVGEGDRFLGNGGMIAMVVENRRVRFDINQAATAKAGLNLSSRLLTVAREVKK